MDFLNWIPTAIGIVLFLGASVVYLRGARDKGTIDALERNNKALNDRVDLLEAEQREDRAQIAGLKTANEVLTNTVNSSELIKSHHEQAMAAVAELRSDLNSLPQRLAAAIKEDH